MKKLAILIDGAFYNRRMQTLNANCKTPKECADFLVKYCTRHAKVDGYNLYRVFYYDCYPSTIDVYNPITKKEEKLSGTEQYKWMTQFIEELKTKRKVALRLGRLSKSGIAYQLKGKSLKKLLRGNLEVSDLTVSDLKLNISQKGVDMKLGVDVSSLAYKGQVDKIVLISGDSDFVPAAKLARREGIDFVLDPLWNHVSSDLLEHIDGLKSCIQRV